MAAGIRAALEQAGQAGSWRQRSAAHSARLWVSRDVVSVILTVMVSGYRPVMTPPAGHV